MVKKRKRMTISLEAIPEEELSYLPRFWEEPGERFFRVTQRFLVCLGTGKMISGDVEEHLRELKMVNISNEQAAALAITAYEHAAALGITDQQRGAWFWNLMMLGCDPKSVKQAVQSAYDLRGDGFAAAPEILTKIVANHFSSRYLQHSAH